MKPVMINIIEQYLSELFDPPELKIVKNRVKKYRDDAWEIDRKIRSLFGEGVKFIVDDLTKYYEKNTDLTEYDIHAVYGWEGLGGETKNWTLAKLYKAHKNNVDKIIRKRVSILRRNLPKIKQLSKSYLSLHKEFEKYLKDNEKNVENIKVVKWFQLLGGYKRMIESLNETLIMYKKGLKASNNKIIKDVLAIDWITGKNDDLYNFGTDFLDEHTMRHMWYEY